jgi:hypothetical protein
MANEISVWKIDMQEHPPLYSEKLSEGLAWLSGAVIDTTDFEDNYEGKFELSVTKTTMTREELDKLGDWEP